MASVIIFSIITVKICAKHGLGMMHTRIGSLLAKGPKVGLPALMNADIMLQRIGR